MGAYDFARRRPGAARNLVPAVLALALAGCAGGASSSPPATGDAGTPSPATSDTATQPPAAYPTKDLEIMAPAGAGGGWDTTARSLQTAIEAESLTTYNVEVYNVEGAGGTIGLAQLVDQEKGNPESLMVMGLVMVGGIVTNDSPVTLDDVTPIASLTAEQEAIVVSADSEYQTLEDLVADWKADPAAISWGGGSAGGTDHILVGLLAQAAGIDPSGINYVAHSGGGEAVTAILSGAVTVGVSGVSEFADQVESGAMRWLAVSGEEPPEGIDAPTIADAGYDVVLENWRGVVGAPDLSDADREAVVALITEMHDSEAWQQALEEHGWSDFFQAGDEFATFLDEEQTRITGVLEEIGLTGG